MDKGKKILSEAIDNAIREAINERLSKRSTVDMLIESVIDEQISLLTEKHTLKEARKANNTEIRTKRRIVLQWLKSPEVNTAEIRRMLEGEPESQEDEDTKRSYFMKKVNQTHGKKFSDEEINQLYSIKSGFGQ